MQPYDAILLLSFGGPEAPDEVVPFLRRVTAGRGIPDERLEQVGEHYDLFGGRSPINDQNRAPARRPCAAELDSRDIDTPLYWGNRNSAPFLEDALREAHADGHRRVVVVTTSAYSCYCSLPAVPRGPRRRPSGPWRRTVSTLEIDKIGPYCPHPGFVEANLGRLVASLRALDGQPDEEVALLFVTHSIPDTMDETSGPGTARDTSTSASTSRLAAR